MGDCTVEPDLFPACKSRKVEVDFEGGQITSDAGGLLLRQVDRRLGLTRDLSKLLDDKRRKGSCRHSQLTMYRQRIYGLALGYEDLNDHDQLRHDPAFQTAVESDSALAISPTLCRLENRADRENAVRITSLMVEKFIQSFKTRPKRLVLDLDATDDPVHGQQEGRFFHGYYDHYCFLRWPTSWSNRCDVWHLRVPSWPEHSVAPFASSSSRSVRLLPATHAAFACTWQAAVPISLSSGSWHIASPSNDIHSCWPGTE